MNATETVRAGQGTIVDVRSPEEFAAGHNEGAVNIPLPEIMHRMEDVQSMKQPLLLVCASGNRSGMAAMMLSREGIDVMNAGGWYDFESKLKAAV